MADSSTPPPVPHSAPARMSGLAITSLVLGILGLFTCGLTALFGLAFGIVALVKVKGSQGTLRGDGIALAGIIVSAVFLLMIPIFAAMLLPALAGAKQRAQTINCVSNEKQLALAIEMYTDQNANHFPAATNWCDAIQSNVSPYTFKCPVAETTGSTRRCDYAFNAALSGLDEKNVNPGTVMLFEADGGWDATGGPDLMSTPARHEHGHISVVTFADGSVQEVGQSQLSSLRWNP
jgi:Domain of unknown function (DUF4190)